MEEDTCLLCRLRDALGMENPTEDEVIEMVYDLMLIRRRAMRVWGEMVDSGNTTQSVLALEEALRNFNAWNV